MPTPNDFTNFQFTQQQQDYGESQRGERSGEYGQGAGPALSSDGMIPIADPWNGQFSSDKESDPRQLLEQTRAGVAAHAELLQAYGLTQPVAGLGVHAWLRDGLSPGPDEPGNEEPAPGNNTPFAGGK